MAIRLVDEYPNRTGSPSSEYPHGSPRNRSAPGAVDGTPFEQAWFRDKEGFMQGLVESAGVTPSGLPDTVTESDYLDALNILSHGVIDVDVSGDQDRTLQLFASRHASLNVTGALAADVDLILPSTNRVYWIFNESTGNFDVSVKTSAGTAKPLPSGFSLVRVDDDNVTVSINSYTPGQSVVVFDAVGVTSWTVPQVLQDGLVKARVTVIGGGGGGGRDFNNAAPGGGGGGEAYAIVDLDGVSSVSVTVGAGGDGATGGNVQTPTAGGSSSFGVFVSATGGGPAGVGSGGVGGEGSGGHLNTSGGGGGGSDKVLGGSSNNVYLSGAGGGAGGEGRSSASSADGNPPRGPGGGGAGSVLTGNGANGADGIVIVEW